MRVEKINKNKKVVVSVFALAIGLVVLGVLYSSDRQSVQHSTAPTLHNEAQSPQSFEDKKSEDANFTGHSTNTSKEEKQEREVQVANIIDESVFLFWEKKPATNRRIENRISDIPPVPPPPPPFINPMPILTRGSGNDEDITPGSGRRSDTDTLTVYGYYCLGNDCVAYTNHGEIRNSGYIRGVGVIRVSQEGIKVE